MYPANVVIATPSDVAAARQAIREAIHEWNAIYSEERHLVLLPVAWDIHSFPAMGERPQAVINRQELQGCDLLVAVFWTRLGSPTGVAPSGTVEEINEHRAAGKPMMIYFSEEPVRLASVADEQYHALLAFKEQCKWSAQAVGGIGRENRLETRRLNEAVTLPSTLGNRGSG